MVYSKMVYSLRVCARLVLECPTLTWAAIWRRDLMNFGARVLLYLGVAELKVSEEVLMTFGVCFSVLVSEKTAAIIS